MIVDFSAICFAQYHGAVKNDTDLETDEDKILYFKDRVLNKLAEFNIKFKPNETILAIDSKSWREDAFTYYKAKRKLKRVDNPIEFKLIYACIDALLIDLKEMNYKIIKVDKAEADDIIGVLCDKFEKDVDTKKVYIISRDKDFQQLTSKKISLYDPIENEIITCNDKDVFLIRLILGGDRSDGIPNVLSDNDVFINENKRQKPCGVKKIDKILTEGLDSYLENDAIFRENYNRNQKLITLNEQFIPEKVWKTTHTKYDEATATFKRKSAIQIGNHFRKIGLNGLMMKINHFI